MDVNTANALSPERILQVGFAFWASKTLLSAVEMEVFTELARRPGTLEDLQGRLGLHARAARDFLDALVALGFLDRVDGIYCNTPATERFLDKRKPSYIGGILEMAQPPALPLLGRADGGAAHRPAAERARRAAASPCSRRSTPIRRGSRSSCGR